MKTKYFLILFIGLSFLFILIFGCTEKETIKIGFSATLTGTDFGARCRNGVELAIDEINNSGGINGRKIKLITKDDENKPEIAIKVDKELINEGVVAIIGHPTSTMTLASLSLINENKMLMISPTVSTNELTGLDDYFFRVGPASKVETYKHAIYMANTLNIKKVSVIYDLSNSKYTEDWYKNFKEKYESLDGKIIASEKFTSGKNPDFEMLIKNLLSSEPEGMVIIANALDTARICQLLYKMNFNKAIVASGWAMTEEFIKNSGRAGENVVFIVSKDYNNKNKNYINFQEKYVRIYGIEPQFHEIHSYEVVMVLKNALLKCENYNSDEIKKQILKQKTFNGLQNDFLIDEYGDVIRSHFYYKVENSQFKKID